jgi:hypothetical protein
MMDKATIRRLSDLNASCCFRIFAPTFREDENSGKLRQIDTGHVSCDILDRTVNEIYATGEEQTEHAALGIALTNAENSPKPLTPAQKQDRERDRVVHEDAQRRVAAAEDRAKQAEDRAAELERRLTAKQPKPKQPDDPPPSKQAA